ncbi:glycine rich protein [Tanacetum coccineum]
MASKTFLLLALAFAVVLLISSQVSAAKEASSHESEVEDDGTYPNPYEDAKYGRDDSGYYNGGRGGNYNNGGGYNGGRGGNYNNGGGRGGGYNNGGRHGGNYCRYGCCGGGRYNRGCRCCSTLAEATAYKQAQTHN